MKVQTASGVGKVSLFLAIAAIVAPMLSYLYSPFETTETDLLFYISVIYFRPLFFVVDIVAFWTGFIGRKSAFAKAGLIISVISLTIVVLSWLWCFYIFITMDSIS